MKFPNQKAKVEALISQFQ